MAEITNEDLLNNGGLMYEVVITCTECDGVACIGMTDSLFEAKERAVESEKMVMDDDNQLHNYISAVAEVSRRVVWTPPRDEADK
jgi:hypothetical protein